MIHIPPKKILVPVDLSKSSEAGWRQAKILADAFGASLEGLYVREWLPLGVSQREIELIAEGTQATVKEIARRLGSGAVVRSLPGVAAEMIETWAANGRYDLVVIGTHGRGAFLRSMLGSVAEALLRDSAVPVLAARSRVGPIRKILAPVNDRPHASKGLLYAARLAKALSAELTVFHAIESRAFQGGPDVPGARALVERLIAKLPRPLRHACRPRAELGVGDASKEIALAARGHDLIVLAAHSKGFMDDWVFGTTAQRVLHHAPCPVWAVPTAGARPQKPAAKKAAARER